MLLALKDAMSCRRAGPEWRLPADVAEPVAGALSRAHAGCSSCAGRHQAAARAQRQRGGRHGARQGGAWGKVRVCDPHHVAARARGGAWRGKRVAGGARARRGSASLLSTQQLVLSRSECGFARCARPPRIVVLQAAPESASPACKAILSSTCTGLACRLSPW